MSANKPETISVPKTKKTARMRCLSNVALTRSNPRRAACTDRDQYQHRDNSKTDQHRAASSAVAWPRRRYAMKPKANAGEARKHHRAAALALAGAAKTSMASSKIPPLL